MRHPRMSPSEENGGDTRAKMCLKCGHRVILHKGFFLCEPCRKSNSHLEDLGGTYVCYLSQALRAFRLRRSTDNN